jgi:hypothetical protein
MVGAAGSIRRWCGLALTAVRHGRAWRLAGVQVFSSHGGRFPMRFAPTGAQHEGNSIRLTLISGARQQNPAMVRRLGWHLVTVRAASGEASAPRTCAGASSSSLLASRLINCSERRWKTRIWWLPRVWWVLD